MSRQRKSTDIAADLETLQKLPEPQRSQALAALETYVDTNLPPPRPPSIAELNKANSEYYFGPAAPAPTEEQQVELHQRNVRAMEAHQAALIAEAEREAVAARDAARAEPGAAVMRGRGDENREKVRIAAAAVIEQHPEWSRDQVIEETSKVVRLAFTTTRDHITALRLFRR